MFKIHEGMGHIEESSPVDPPFLVEDQLNSELSMPDALLTGTHLSRTITGKKYKDRMIPVPGQPLLDVLDSRQITEFLKKQLLTDRLDSLHPILWLVATQRSDHISALHHQIVKGREIIITEDPGLHLVWYYERIYIKPLPPCLLNHAFWNTYLSGNSGDTAKIRRAALGFMRTYVYLIQSQYDFDIARGNNLIPKIPDDADGFTAFLHFIDPFRHILDYEVNRRYCHYGELRLSRLNLWSRLYTWQLFYHKIDGQYGAYFARFIPPFIFIFGTVSVALAGMQVVLAVDNGKGREPKEAFLRVSNGFSLLCLVAVAAALIFFPVAQVFFLMRELVYVVTHQKKPEDPSTGTPPNGS